MANAPFTISIFVPDGDPQGLRKVERFNWTGVGIAFPREKWPEVRKRPEFDRTGVYILAGFSDPDDELQTIYVGEADEIRDRLESHYLKKDFWNDAYAFVSSSTDGRLNKAHIRWLEHALVRQAKNAKRCKLDNGNEPQDPPLSEAEKADSRSFLGEILQLLPIMGLNVFQEPKPIAIPQAIAEIPPPEDGKPNFDTVVVPAREEGFKKVFLGQNQWHAIRMSGGMLQRIKYIAAYQVQPVMAITHYAPIAHIKPYGEGSKYQLDFSEPAKEIPPIPFADAPAASMMGPRYTTLQRLLAAKKLTEAFF